MFKGASVFKYLYSSITNTSLLLKLQKYLKKYIYNKNEICTDCEITILGKSVMHCTKNVDTI